MQLESSWNHTPNFSISAANSALMCPVPISDSAASSITKTIAYALIFLLSIVGNSFILLIIYKEKDLRSTTNFLIANMSVSDLLASVFFMPIAILEIHNGHRSWPIDGLTGSILCKLVYFIHDVSVAVSVESLTFISIDRFCGIVQPHRRKPFVGRVKKVVLFIWLNALVLHSPFLYAFQLTNYKDKTYCLMIWPPSVDYVLVNKAFFLSLIAIFFVLPLGFIVVLQSLIIRKFHRQKMPRGLSCEARLRRHRRNRKVVAMVLAVIVVFFSCWSPIIVYSFIVLFKTGPCPVSVLFRFIASFIVESNKSWNFFLYLIFNNTYRRSLANLFKCGKRDVYNGEISSHVRGQVDGEEPQPLNTQEGDSLYYH